MRQIPIDLDDALSSAKNRLWRLTPPQVLISSFVALSLIGAFLLKLPFASNEPTTWLQALFTSVSASTVTGLVVVDTGTHFTIYGQLILLALMQLGGLGLMTFGVFIIHLTKGGSLSMSERIVVSEALNQPGQADLMRQMTWLIGFTVTMELVGTALLAAHWVPQMGWQQGWYYSFFHAISAFNNAGFGLASDSLTADVGSSVVNIIISALFISGGIGFVVVLDMLHKQRFRDYALHTKLMVIGTLVINLIAMAILLLLEYGNPDTLGGLPSLADKLWAAWFQAVTPRTAGFNSIDIGALLPASAFFIMGMMFIGGGSGSTASGIKLSTFIVLLLATRSFFFRQERPVIFGRSLGSEVVLKALAITIVSLFCILTGTFLLALSESEATFLDLAFEAVSAFATVGLSRGVTADLSPIGQYIIMALMLVGRVGPITLAFLLTRRHSNRIRYPDGQVNVG